MGLHLAGEAEQARKANIDSAIIGWRALIKKEASINIPTPYDTGTIDNRPKYPFLFSLW